MPNVRLALVLMTFLGSAKPYTIDLSPGNHDQLSNGQEVDGGLPIEKCYPAVDVEAWLGVGVPNGNDCGCDGVFVREFWFEAGSSIVHGWCEFSVKEDDVDCDALQKTR